MSTDALAQLSQRMVSFTMMLLIAVVLINSLVLFFPALSFSDELRGIRLSLYDQRLSALNVSLRTLPWWQAAGVGVISLLVMAPLCYSLYQLRSLFKAYAQRNYFSASSAQYMSRVGGSLVVWTVMNLLADPVISYWLTLLNPPGEREILFGFELQHIIWIFISLCVMAVAKILEKASVLYEENKLFL
ncbi:TPA: DUF2975 domain-containing protein [Kluyvera georgiana]|uniref:DUF2975 domain-containing protein n=1 Tax=Kluyvera georgiana TaxID=73098 RepID=UPI0008071361|nr:DUF2975 domain-containing protein [Kluyvera georgiana]HDG1693116.1 DUF2975 domain-containing protein [Kluyvera georgiana]HED1421522.1 DUF2975 domain-containing protein [Kluyvera georgiana]